jgi:ribonucleoside-diphosphate reductase alpha chain
LIKTAVEKIDIDVPNWTYVASRLFLYDLYHRAGKATHGIKGSAYCHIKDYIKNAQLEGRIIPELETGYDLDDLNATLVPCRDKLFTYLGIKTLNDRYLIKNSKGEPIELPQQMFMGIAMFLAQNETNKQEKAKEFYHVISQFEVMLATPTLSNARTNRHQLSSCYIGSSPDNIEGIFDGYKEMGLLSKFGGGIGWDWNSIRALGGVIDNHKSAAGGVVPFLKITNDIALAVDQLGTRKGAIAVYLEPWHMDIVRFHRFKEK